MEGALGGIAQGHVARGAKGGRSGAEIGLNGRECPGFSLQPREKELAVLSLPHPPNPRWFRRRAAGTSQGGRQWPGGRGCSVTRLFSFWPAAALSTDPSVLGKYRAGFSECMNEVTRFLSTCEGVNTEVRTRLLGHLANCMTQINAMTYPGQPHPALQAPPPPPSGPGGPQHAPFAPPPPLVPIPGGAAPPPGSAPCKLGSQAGEAAKVFGGFQVVPAPDGQFAFLIPNGAFAHSGPVIPVYTSNSGTSVGPNAVSPSSGSSLTADSMWRPWRN